METVHNHDEHQSESCVDKSLIGTTNLMQITCVSPTDLNHLINSVIQNAG